MQIRGENRIEARWSRFTFVLLLLCAVLLFELPSLLTLLKLGWEPIPPVLVADQNLYLNLSAIHHVSDREVVNPWYGTRVRAVDVPHLIFPITFVLVRMMHKVFPSWTIATLAWNAIWTALTYWAAVFCLSCLFPDSARILRNVAALGLLVLQSPLTYLAQFTHGLDTRHLFEVPLPNLRFAIPQVILPAVLMYWGVLARALKSTSRVRLLALVLLQFFVCAAFPYFLPVLALGTGITLLLCRYRDSSCAWSWQRTLAFAGICGAADIGYALLAGFGRSNANVHVSLQFRPEMILLAIRPYMVLLAIAAVLALISKTPLATRLTVVGIGFSSAVFGFADIFFRPEAQMLQHPNYFIGIVTWLVLGAALWPIVEKVAGPRCQVGIACILILIGAWEAFSSFKTMLPVNTFQESVLHEIGQLSLSERDLVIAPSRFSDDVSSWIPLVSPARVLFTDDGENILSAEDTRTLQTRRQALYLTFCGMDLAALEARTRDSSSDSEIHPLLQQTDRTFAGSPLKNDRVLLRQLLRARMAPLLSEIQNDPAASGSILKNYDRIIVIDSSANPIFSRSALSKWLTTDHSYEHNGVAISLCHARSALLDYTSAVTKPGF